MIAGFYAGFVSCFITSPTELIKCVCQLEEGAESATIKNELKVALRLTSQYGFFRGLWRGFHVTVLQKDIINFIHNFFFFKCNCFNQII